MFAMPFYLRQVFSATPIDECAVELSQTRRALRKSERRVAQLLEALDSQWETNAAELARKEEQVAALQSQTQLAQIEAPIDHDRVRELERELLLLRGVLDDFENEACSVRAANARIEELESEARAAEAVIADLESEAACS
jgi:chromosome segregation ATPase